MSNNPLGTIKALEWVDAAIGIVSECQFQDYAFKVDYSRTGAVYLQGSYSEADTVTGQVETQVTRRWFLSPEMTKSEIVSTAFKCAITSMEHRTREWFLYRGKAIYQPHYDVDTLWRVCDARDTRKTEAT